MLSNPSFPHSPFPQLPSPHGVFCSKSSTFKLFFIIPYCVNFLLVQDLIISCLHCWNISQNLLPLQGQTVIVASSLVSLSLVFPAIPMPPAPIHWAHTGRLMFLMPLPCSKKTCQSSQSPQPHSLGMPLSGPHLPYIYCGLSSSYTLSTLLFHLECLSSGIFYVLCTLLYIQIFFKALQINVILNPFSPLCHVHETFLSGCDYIQLWPHH